MTESTSQAPCGIKERAFARKFLERRASRIEDPIEKLRYLRQSAAVPEPKGPVLSLAGTQPLAGTHPKPRRRRVVVWATAPVVLAATALLMVPVSHTASRQPGRGASTGRIEQAAPAPQVWLVDKTGEAELYSNGLRVERRYMTRSEPMPLRAFARSAGAAPESLSAPAGIVFHASESDLAPFEPDQAQRVKRQALGLLDWVRSKNLYHYVVDRIGRVYRILNDTERADHAGNSVWADSNRIYVNLNGSFLGVAFEARTGTKLEAAQVHAGRILVEMLRSRYHISPENCVTHAQVSVNPANFLVGYHTDWIANFPFHDLGLADNYGRSLASVELFGFSYDPGYIESAAPPLRESVLRSERRIKADVADDGLSGALRQRNLRVRYTQLRAAIAPAHQESYGIN